MFLDAGGYRHAAGVEEPNPDPATIETVRAHGPGGFLFVFGQDIVFPEWCLSHDS